MAQRHGVIAVAFGQGVEDRIRAASKEKVDTFIDTFGGGYIELALNPGIPANLIDTIIDFAAAEKYGVKTEGNADAANARVLGELAGLMAAGRLEIPIAKVYPFNDVRDAYRELEQRHTHRKVVLKTLTGKVMYGRGGPLPERSRRAASLYPRRLP